LSKSAHPGSVTVRFALALAVTSTAFSSIIVAELEQSGVPPLVVAFYRSAIAAAVLAVPALAMKRREFGKLTRREMLLITASGFCLAVHFGAWIWSLKYIPIATSVLLVNSHPLLVVIASRLILGEAQSSRRMIGLAVGLLGTAVIFWEGFSGIETALVGDALAMLGSVATVGYFLLGRSMRARISLLAYVTPLYVVCALFLAAGGAVANTRFYPYSAKDWLLLAALAILPTIVGHTIFNWALRYVSAPAVAMNFLAEPVVASILALLFFNQRPEKSTLVGGVFVLAGVYLATQGPVVDVPAKNKSGEAQ
jgi:drug/metabolite transporter (DMT)-like permease